ncbi:transposase IS116/IS110/IS902 family protein [Kineococcus xinjiangensis]|uniref:Transposase IS116/IS110/IS902 family protein n=1 Tax=Kineococcus xinjiangensis TaxID=512762 RepID=A0A2S6IC06_9ACTN|nr:IS110 family transposase [Kineococcus xinjiangensis]PPK90183.1 transposase IS116/IS110/IS902 family protein [Kineococcus xinjiangensis]
MDNASRISRGDKSRNARLGRLRELVPITSAVVGIDLADAKQMVVVCDHDSRVLARRTFRVRAWDLGAALDWAAAKAAKAGFAAVTVACEPTGHRWRVLGQLAAERGMAFVCVQPLISAWARRGEDLTSDKTDEKDAVVIARLAAQLRCYAPEPVDETWGRLRHLGARRERLMMELTGQVQAMRDLLECVWPAALEAAAQPFKSRTWAATMSIILERDGGDFTRTRRLGLTRLENLVRKEVMRWGAEKPTLRITRNLFAALDDNAGVLAHRPGALERVAFVLDDFFHARRRKVEVEERMTLVLEELGVTELVTSIPGLSAVGAAAILAETGDPHRFTSARALVKHADLAPRERSSGAFTGRTRVTGQGRPSLRLAAWRGIWGTLRGNPVHAARYHHLTTREQNKLKPTQAQAAVAAALLRQLHAVIVTGRPWDAEIATYGTRRRPLEVAA